MHHVSFWNFEEDGWHVNTNRRNSMSSMSSIVPTGSNGFQCWTGGGHWYFAVGHFAHHQREAGKDQWNAWGIQAEHISAADLSKLSSPSVHRLNTLQIQILSKLVCLGTPYLEINWLVIINLEFWRINLKIALRIRSNRWARWLFFGLESSVWVYFFGCTPMMMVRQCRPCMLMALQYIKMCHDDH